MSSYSAASAFLISVVLLLCTLNSLVGRSDAAITADFTNQTFTENGTNLVARFEFDEDVTIGQLNCTYTFPGDKTFFQVRDRYMSFSSITPAVFRLVSDITSATLTTGVVKTWNNGTITNGTSLTYYLFPFDQQKNKGGAFSLTASCLIDGTFFNATFNSVDIDNGGKSASSSLSGFFLPAISYLLF